jgi:hypothetical protein
MMALLLTVLALPAAKAPPPPGVVVLAGSPEYQALREEEQSFAGRLRQSPAGYRLEVVDGLGRATFVELHAPGKAYLLVAWLDQHVQMLGKVVPGKEARLWPGRVFQPGKDGPGPDGVIARAPLTFRPGLLAARPARHLVLLDEDQLAAELGVSGPTAGATARKIMAARMGRADIDFRKEMIVKVDGGLAPSNRQTRITSAVKEGGKLVVRFQRRGKPADEGGGLHPSGELALVPRFEGPVEFLLSAIAPPKPRLP